jgi:hypothetical protein
MSSRFFITIGYQSFDDSNIEHITVTSKLHTRVYDTPLTDEQIEWMEKDIKEDLENVNIKHLLNCLREKEKLNE